MKTRCWRSSITSKLIWPHAPHEHPLTPWPCLAFDFIKASNYLDYCIEKFGKPYLALFADVSFRCSFSCTFLYLNTSNYVLICAFQQFMLWSVIEMCSWYQWNFSFFINRVVHSTSHRSQLDKSSKKLKMTKRPNNHSWKTWSMTKGGYTYHQTLERLHQSGCTPGQLWIR